jgi:hypothetical protein
MANIQWDSFEQWHDLFDALCIERGYLDNSELATVLCGVANKNEQLNYHATMKNLGNWRRGLHIPSRKNFLALTKVLAVKSAEEAEAAWFRLYAEARKPVKVADVGLVAPVALGPMSAHWTQLLGVRAIASAIFCVACMLAVPFYLLGAASGNLSADVEYRRAISLRLGETSVVHGARSACGDAAPSWDHVRSKLPDIEIGIWSDGGEGKRYSRACGGPTPARGVRFTATASGLKEIKLYGDPVSIHVE